MSLEPSTQPDPSRLLVVDDEPAVLKVVKAILTRARYDVTTCENAAQAEKCLDEEPFDCIITDAIMPSTDGYEFVKSLRQETFFKEIPILMLTRKRDREDVKMAVDVGVTDYVIKPIDEPLLLDKIETCLKKHSGKRRLFEVAIGGPESKAQILHKSVITNLSETSITTRLPFEIPINTILEMKTSLFDAIGIKTPLIKISAIREDASTLSELPFEGKSSLVGVPEADLRKIRTWLRRQELLRRK